MVGISNKASKFSKALIIANGASCSESLLKATVEKANYLIVLDSAMERLEELGIIPDVLLGDFDRNFVPLIYQKKYPKIELVYAESQDKTDLEKAFDFLIQKKIRQVTVVWATGKRSDHSLANLSCIVKYRKNLAITLVDDHSKIRLLERNYSAWHQANTILSLMALGKVSGISTQNLYYPLTNENLNSGYRMGNSNYVIQDGLVTIEHKRGDLLLMECID